MNNIVASRRCDYKGCNEYRDKTHLNPDLRFFSLPSDSERRKKWLTLSQTTSENPKFICSKHFEDKFISRVQRRVHLIISAVPIDYNATISQYNDDTYKPELVETERVIDDDDQTILDILENDININETTQEEISDDKNSNSYKKTNFLLNSVPIIGRRRFPESLRVYNDHKTMKKVKQFKLLNLNKADVETKIDLIKNEEEIKMNNKNVSNEPESKKRKANDTYSKVKTIIIEEEEYIQMPKSLYIEERMDLLNKIKYYRSVLKDFKDKLNDMDFS